jgi:hypothetical protein
MRISPDDKDAAFDKADSSSAVSHLEQTSRQPLHAGMNQNVPVGYAQTHPAKSNVAPAAPAAVHSFEIEPTISSTITSKESWLQRLPWRRSEQNQNSDTLDFVKPGEAIYLGGQMEADPRPGLGFTVGQEETPAPEQPKRRAMGYAVGFSPRNDEAAKFRPYSFQAVSSWLSSRSSSKIGLSGDEDSLADFEDSEWTQQDSSYGAAIPFGGWIPKNIRRIIESTLIALLFIGLVYLVVATSIRVTEETSSRHSNTTGNGTDYGGLNLDDDRYVAYGNDDASSIYGYSSNDDAYSNGDDTYSNQNDDGSGSGSRSGYGDNNNQGNGYNSNSNNGDDANTNDDDAYGGGRRLLPSLDVIDELLA